MVTLLSSVKFDTDTFWTTLFSTQFVKPAVIAVFAAFMGMALGIILGVLGALCLASRMRWLHPVVRGYVWVFRGIPALVQIVFWYDGLSQLTGVNLSPFVAGALALGINEGAYMTEIVRSGLLAVDSGQQEAAAALSLSPLHSLRFVVAPQALRILVPPVSNQFIVLLKNTSLLFVISVPEIFATGQIIFTQNYRYMEVLAVVSLWYLALTGLATLVQRRLEARFGAQDGPGFSSQRRRRIRVQPGGARTSATADALVGEGGR
jgi:polar amino acid transport system permease protein